MKYNPDIHHRHSIRLKGYNYSQAGVYFVTICTEDRECLFGDVMDGAMRLNDVGIIIENVWIELKNRFPNIELDEFVIMPNHFHGIIITTNNGCETNLLVIFYAAARFSQNSSHRPLI